MIIEHEKTMCNISLLLTDILKPYTREVDFTVKYLNDVEFPVLEVFVRHGQIQDIDQNIFVKEVTKSDVVNNIYTIEDGKLYSILLRPLKEIRNFKINKLQNKITNEAYN